jgi:hypothetical protein
MIVYFINVSRLVPVICALDSRVSFGGRFVISHETSSLFVILLIICSLEFVS